MKNKTILAISDSDLDGTSSRIMFEWFLSEDNKLFTEQSSVGQNTVALLENLDLSKFDVIGFADLVPTAEFYSNLLTIGPEIHVWDHHETSREIIEGIENPNYHFDITRSSTKIVYDYFEHMKPFNNAVKEFAEIVNVWDLWKTKSRYFYYAKGLSSMLYKQTMQKVDGYRKFIDHQHKKFLTFPDHYKFFDKELEYMEKQQIKEDKMFEEIMQDIKFMYDSENRKYAFIKANTKRSILCSRVLNQFDDLDYVLCHVTFNLEDKQFSLRSTKIAVNNLAARFFGGGHISASGFSLLEFPEQYNQLMSGENIF